MFGELVITYIPLWPEGHCPDIAPLHGAHTHKYTKHDIKPSQTLNTQIHSQCQSTIINRSQNKKQTDDAVRTESGLPPLCKSDWNVKGHLLPIFTKLRGLLCKLKGPQKWPHCTLDISRYNPEFYETEKQMFVFESWTAWSTGGITEVLFFFSIILSKLWNS